MTGASSLRELALLVAAENLGQPYLWGGNDPIAGFDCSGLVIESLKSVGVLPRTGDWSAHALLNDVFRGKKRWTAESALLPGMLIFWARPDGHIRHVEMVFSRLEGKVITIGASGGGSKTTSREAAIKQDAYVKLRPVNAGWVAAVDPF